MDIVLIPCFRRPEFLAACLKYISMADGWKDNHYYFSIDSKVAATGKHDPEVEKVIAQFPGKKTVKIRRNHFNGNTCNVLEGYKECFELGKQLGSELIYMIETDIFVSRDFFTFHKAAQQLDPDCFYVSACRNQNYKAAQSLPNEPENLYKYERYQSLGNSFKMAQVAKFIQHATPQYYGDMWGYLSKAFNGPKYAPFRGMWCEQDGMLNRLMVGGPLYGLFPYAPRAYHAGFHGYNRPGQSLDRKLSLTARTVALMTMTEEEMNRRAGNKAYKDITMCDLLGHEVKQFTIKQNGIPLRPSG